jgi:hypothetical protein
MVRVKIGVGNAHSALDLNLPELRSLFDIGDLLGFSLSADSGLWPKRNSSPQPSHLSVPISWKPIVFSRLLFFIATARMS